MIKGIDVAFYEPVIDWGRVKAAGNEFAFIKASQSDYADPKFLEHWRNSRGVMPRGAYHFYDPRFRSPREQAEKFISLLRDDPGELPPAVDIELYVTGPYRGADNWYDFISRVRDFFGRYPIVYTAYYYWNDESKINPVNDLGWFRNCPLWIANYDVNIPLVPQPWNPDEWSFWQYSGTGFVDGVTNSWGRPTECDLDYYNGTKEEMYKKFLILFPPTTEEPPMERFEAVNLYDSMALRPDHSTSNTATARYNAGQLWYGNETYVVPENAYGQQGQLLQQKDDIWLRVSRINSTPVTGWVAIVHKAYRYCNLTDHGPVAEPVHPVSATVTMSDGTTWEADVWTQQQP